MRSLLALGALSLGVALPLQGWAEGGGQLVAAREAMDRLEYGEAREALGGALASGHLEPVTLAETYRRLAECFAALRMPEEARDAFERLLAIDPDFEVAEDQSPLVRQPFEEAVAFWRGRERPRLRFLPPQTLAAGEPLVVEPDVEPGAIPGLAAEITLHLLGPAGETTTFVGADGQIEVSAAELAGLDHAAFYLALRDEHGNAVAYLGGPEDPIEVAIEEGGSGPGGPPPGGRPWYTEWWLWTAVSVVVVGLAVGLPVGLALGGGGGDPCQGALGGPCDMTASFGD